MSAAQRLQVFRFVVCLLFLLSLLVYLQPELQLLYQEHVGDVTVTPRAWWAARHSPTLHTHWEVEAAKRDPGMSMVDFYRGREDRRLQQLIDNRTAYSQQPHEGSVMLGGFHTDLPQDTMWQDHKLVQGTEVATLLQAQREQERQQREWQEAYEKAQQAAPPSTAPPPTASATTSTSPPPPHENT
jgi:hypothetical protein